MDAATAVPASLWHNREYLRYRAGRLVSVLGSQLSGLAFPLLVLALGGSALEVGVLASFALFVKLGSQLPGGYLADRYSRRGLMITADLVRVVAYGSIPLAAALGRPPYAQLLVIAVIDGAGAAVFSAAATAALRDLVPAAQIPKAISQTQVTMGTMALIGPVLGGLCFAASRMLPFILDACSYLLSAVLLAGLAARPGALTAVGEGRQRAGQQMSAGLRWLRGQPGLLRIVAFGAALNLAATAAQVTAVVGLRERGTPAGVIGIVMACTGSGMVAGAFAGRRIVAWLGPVRLYLVAGTVWTAGLAVCAIHPSAPVIGPVLALLCLLSPASGIALAQATLGQAPPHLLGRVGTSAQMLGSTLAAIGPLLAGLALRSLGTTPVWVMLGALCLTATVVAILPLAIAARPRAGADRAPQPSTPAREAGT